MKRNNCLSFATLFSLLLHSLVHGILTRVPENLITLRGRDIVLYCHTNLTSPVHWDVDRVEQPTSLRWDTVYGEDPAFVLQKFEPRFSVSVDSSNTRYDLRITDVQPQDAGTYRCAADGGLGLEKYTRGVSGYEQTAGSADLIVLEEEGLTCNDNIKEDGHAGGNQANPDQPPEVITVTCRVSYIGNIPPAFNWSVQKNNGGKRNQPVSLNNFSVTSASNDNGNLTATSTLSVHAASWLQDSNIKCELVAPGSNASAKNSITPYTSNKIQMNVVETQQASSFLMSILYNLLVSVAVIALVVIGFLLWKKFCQPPQPPPATADEMRQLLGNPQCDKNTVIIPHMPDNNTIPFICAIDNSMPSVYHMVMNEPGVFAVSSNHVFQRQGDFPLIRQGVASCVLNRNLYIIGAGVGQNEIWRYVSNEERWHRCGNMSGGRVNHSVVAVGDCIYVLGGIDTASNKVLDTVEWYDSKNWADGKQAGGLHENGAANNAAHKGQLKIAVCNAAACLHVRGNSIYIFGGTIEKAPHVTCRVQAFEIATGKCEFVEDLHGAYTNMKAVVYGEYGILIGKDVCYLYKFLEDKFENRQDFKVNCQYFGLYLDNQNLYLMGGAEKKGGNEDAEAGWTYNRRVLYVSINNFKKNEKSQWKIWVQN